MDYSPKTRFELADPWNRCGFQRLPKPSTMEGEDTPMPRQFNVVIERDAEGYYVASVPQIRGAIRRRARSTRSTSASAKP